MSLSTLQLGQSVLIQCDKSKKWDPRGEINEIRPDGLSYLVDMEGKAIIRGRAILKPVFKNAGVIKFKIKVKESNKKGSYLLVPTFFHLLDDQKDSKKKKKDGCHCLFQLRQRGRCRKVARISTDAAHAWATN